MNDATKTYPTKTQFPADQKHLNRNKINSESSTTARYRNQTKLHMHTTHVSNAA